MTTFKNNSVNSRLLEVIELISMSPTAISPADISIQLGIPKPTVHRLLQQLQYLNYIKFDQRGNWVPASRLASLAKNILYSQRDHLERLAILQGLMQETGETCGISIPQGLEMVYFERVQSNWPLQIHLPTGSTVPIWCTASGKLYLSSLSSTKRQRILASLNLSPYSRNTLIDKKQLERNITDIKKQDYGVDNEEFVDGMVACSVPIRDEKGHMLACLFLHAPTVRKQLDELLSHVPVMQDAAKHLAALMFELKN